MVKKKLIIFGIGETASIAYEMFSNDSSYEVIAFCVNSEFLNVKQKFNLPVVDFKNIENTYSPSQYEMFIAIGSNHLNRDRTNKYIEAKQKGYTLASYVSSKADVWHKTRIGDNCFIMSGSIVQPFATIGNNVFLWINSTVGHSGIVEDNCFLATAITAGRSVVGKNTFLGGAVAVADNVKIAKDNFIAMGSIVIKNTIENSIYRGNPACRIKEISAKRFCQIGDNE